MSVNSPSPILEIFLANPVVMDASLASIKEVALPLMVISGGAADDQSTPSLKGKEVVVAPEEAVHE